ncbi:MAG: carbohydrate ABC transporter permease [Propionibacteriaceae bacterium]|jgi:multiple sugar transport system permease protein|nr:carbohydrate ABC transporter permease [Propionibacteriaceae bacterium]
MKRHIRVLLYVAAVAVGLFMVAPFAWMVVASFQTQAELVARPLRWWPGRFFPDRYVSIFTDPANDVFRTALRNSLIVSVAVVAVSMFVGILGAYAFARLNFRFRRAVLMMFLFTYMLPQIALLIPLYMILNNLSLLDTIPGLVVVDCSLVVPFVLWILSNYFLTIPAELEESAWIDGASRLGALVRIVLPSARPGLFAAAMFAFLLAWDEFMYALIFTSSTASKTVPVAIAEFSGRYSTDFGLVAAGGVLAALPPVVLAVLFQRHVVSGLVSGAVKT